MTTDQILLGVGLTLMLAVGCLILAAGYGELLATAASRGAELEADGDTSD